MTNGNGIWNVTISGAASKHSSDLRVISDGYLFHFSGDGYMYVFGKGLTKTTVTAPASAVQVGEAFTISGNVLDMSPAQEGTPAICDEDMGPWMEYLHQQMTKPTDAKGVTVTLTALDPNNNYIYLGEATSNSDGTFGFTWVPEVPGLYRITATFAGTDSYGSSSATTYMSAVYPPEENTPEPTMQPVSISDLYFVPAIAGIAVLIVIIGAVLAVLVMKKRP